MREFKRILCPVDFSDASAHAIDQAIALAGWCNARITALHIFTPTFALVPGLPSLEQRASDAEWTRVRDQVAQCFEPAAAAGVGVDILIEVGRPAQHILDGAAERSADLIVMGTHGASGFQHLVLGSVTEKVLRTALRRAHRSAPSAGDLEAAVLTPAVPGGLLRRVRCRASDGADAGTRIRVGADRPPCDRVAMA